MKRSIARLALFVAVLAGSPARAEVDVPLWPDPGPPQNQPMTAGPIITTDGTIVFGIRVARERMAIMRLAPGAEAPAHVTDIGVPLQANPFVDELVVNLAAAGPGFLLESAVFNAPVHCCATAQYSSDRLTWFPDPAGPGTDLAACAGPCTAHDVVHVAGADASSALLTHASGPTVVRDLATGAETALPADWTDVGGIAGRYVTARTADGGVVADWRTGQAVRRTATPWPWVLLPDGTIYFGAFPVSRWRLEDDAPRNLPVGGFVSVAAGDRLLATAGPRGIGAISVWSPDGSGIDQLPPAPGPFAFDGRRVVALDRTCMTLRVLTWNVGGGHEDALSPVCGPARVGEVVLGPHAVRAPVACPALLPQGCLGTLSLAASGSRVLRLALRAGERRTYALRRGISGETCHRLVRNRRWRVRLETDTFAGRTARSVRVTRRDRCGPVRRAEVGRGGFEPPHDGL